MPEITNIAVFDTETDGVSTEECHVVTAFLGLMDVATGELVEKKSWLINTGHQIPQGAIDVHGITNEKMQSEGADPKDAIFEIILKLNAYERANIPVVIYNARFDASLIDAETRRHFPGMKRLDWTLVIDPLIIWKKVDRFRKGKRTLVTAAEAMGVAVLENAHDAEADCIMAGQVAIKLLQHQWIAPLTMPKLMERQIKNAREQAESLDVYFHKNGTMTADEHVDGGWPLSDECRSITG